MANLIPRIVEVTDVFGAVHDGAELAFVNAWYIEHDVLHAFWQWRLAALWYLQFFFEETLVFVRVLEEEELLLAEDGAFVFLQCPQRRHYALCRVPLYIVVRGEGCRPMNSSR